jgi:hypothetical protein
MDKLLKVLEILLSVASLVLRRKSRGTKPSNGNTPPDGAPLSTHWEEVPFDFGPGINYPVRSRVKVGRKRPTSKGDSSYKPPKSGDETLTIGKEKLRD